MIFAKKDHSGKSVTLCSERSITEQVKASIIPWKMPLAYAEASASDLAYGTLAHFRDLAYGTSAEGHSPEGGARLLEPLLWFSLYTKDPISSFILRGTNDKPLYSTLAVEHPTIRHLDYEFVADVP